MEHYSFGKTLKDLRRSQNMTQSRLAELLMISPQAVSKWENDIGYPDLPLLAPISEVFGVTVDYLLGKNENTKAQELAWARERTQALEQDDEHDTAAECIAIWREMLRKYPADNACRNALAFALRSACKTMPAEVRRAWAGEAAALYEAVLDESRDSGEREFARSELVWVYGNLLHETELAEKHAKQAGDIHCSMPHLMAAIADHPEQKHWQQYEVWYMTGGLAWAIAEQRYATAEEAIFAYRTALKVIDTVCYDASYAYFDSYFSAYFRRRICQLRAESGALDDSIYADIAAMLESCRRADAQPLGQHTFAGNLFMDSICHTHTLRDSELQWAKALLDEPAFDAIRGEERFKALV